MRRKVSFLVPSLADIFFLCPFLLLSLDSGNKLLNDAGTGFHIRTGQYVIANVTIPRYDLFSQVTPPLPWFAHEWLSGVIMALVHQIFGLTGIVLFFSFLISLTYFLLFKFVRSDGANIIVCSLVIFLAAASSTLHWLARPHIFTLILTLLWYCVLEAYQYRNKNYLFLLPLIMLLWVNLHGGFLIGFVFLAIYLCGNAGGALFLSAPEHELCRQKFWALTYTAFGCLLFSLVNPHGYDALLFPFKLVSDQPLVDMIMEHRSANFHESMPFKYLLFLTIAILALTRAKVNLIELSLVLLFTYMALYSVRHIPLFAIIVTPILVRHTDLILQKADGKLIDWFRNRSQNLAFIDGQLQGYIWPILALLAVSILAGIQLIRFNFDRTRMPVAAVDFLKREKIKGNMFNPEQFGDYLIYAAWPQYKVSVDGRIDMYGADRMKEYMKVAMVQPGWKDVLAKYDVNFVFYNVNSPISLLLAQRDDWRLVYADNVADIFVRNVEENQNLVKKYLHRVSNQSN
jgi:hypothetical protein